MIMFNMNSLGLMGNMFCKEFLALTEKYVELSQMNKTLALIIIKVFTLVSTQLLNVAICRFSLQP